VPVAGAQVRLRWRQEEDGAWRDSPTLSHTDDAGDFASFLRLTPGEAPELDPDDGKVIVRLRVSRPGLMDRTSAEFKLAEGRITNPTSDENQTFAWDELTL